MVQQVKFLESQLAITVTRENDFSADFWEIFASCCTHGGDASETDHLNKFLKSQLYSDLL